MPVIDPTESSVPLSPPVSKKVTASSLGSLAAGVALAVVLALLTPEGLQHLAGLPPVVTFVLVSALPPVASFLAGFSTSDSVTYLQSALTKRLTDSNDPGRHEA